MTSATLPIDIDQTRKWSVGPQCGEVFNDGADYDGLTVVIELRSPIEAKAVLEALLNNVHEE